jgi:hypothetical protein
MNHLEVSRANIYPIDDVHFIFTLFQDFESTLKDVVNAKRLSVSKMSKLTEIALKSMEVRVKIVLEDLFTQAFCLDSTTLSLLRYFIALTSHCLVLPRCQVSMCLMLWHVLPEVMLQSAVSLVT